MSKSILLNNNKKKIKIFLLLFFAIVITLLVLSSIYDLQISKFLTNSSFNSNQYFSTNIFANAIEIIGMWPLYVMISIIFSIFYFKSRQIKNKNYMIMSRVLFLTISIVVIFLCIFLFDGSWMQLIITNCKNDSKLVFIGSKIIYPILGSLFLNGLIFLLFKRIKQETISKLFIWAIIVAICVALGVVFTEMIKNTMPRMRFRTIQFTGGDFDKYFRNWYELAWNFNDKFEIPGLKNVGSDCFKSFWSGHTLNASSIYGLMFISFFIPIKKQANKILFFNILPILIVSIVAFGRIIAGAHYMSDTIFGGTIMFSILCGIFYIHYKYKMHLLHK